MIYIGSYIFEIIEGPSKTLKLKLIAKGGPYESEEQFSPAVAEAYRDLVLQDLHYVTKKIFNEDYYVKAKILEHLESLAKYYNFEDMTAWFSRYWEDWEQSSFSNGFDAERKNRVNTEYNNMKLISEFKSDIMLSDLNKEMKKAEINYLEEQNTNLSSQINKIKSDTQRMEDRDYDSWLIELNKKIRNHKKLTGKYRYNKIKIATLKDKSSFKKTIVTDDMIALAKKVPFNNLLNLETIGNRKRCRCPFHNEKTASFYIYPDTNRGYCHGCGKSVDTIQYLVEIKKMKFNEAVLMLLSY